MDKLRYAFFGFAIVFGAVSLVSNPSVEATTVKHHMVRHGERTRHATGPRMVAAPTTRVPNSTYDPFADLLLG